MNLTKERQREIAFAVDMMLAQLDMEYPESSLLDIINALGIKVYITDLGKFSNTVSGILDREQLPIKIYLNKNHSKTRQAFTLAHELGHHALHKKGNKYRIDYYDYFNADNAEETEANYFAACLLVPEHKLRQLLRETNDIKAIAEYFGVSTAVINVRLNWIRMN